MRFLLYTTPLLIVFLTGTTPLQAQEYSVETINEAAPVDDLSAEISGKLADNGFRVLRGSRSIWEFWPVKQCDVEAGFEPTLTRLYPFVPGELIGVVRLPRRGADFREQTLQRGVYTVRYALQPVDGNHVGTSPTSDFLLLARATDDTSPEPMEADPLIEASATAAESSHPAMMCLQKLDDNAASPAVRLLEDREWWVLRLPASTADGKVIPMDVVVVGHAAE